MMGLNPEAPFWEATPPTAPWQNPNPTFFPPPVQEAVCLSACEQNTLKLGELRKFSKQREQRLNESGNPNLIFYVWIIILTQISVLFSAFLSAKLLWWQSLKKPHMPSCKRATFVGCAVLCGQNGGQCSHDYPLTLFRFPPAQSARPTTLREPAVRPESKTLMSSSTPAPDTGSHSLFRRVGPASGQRSDRQSQAAPPAGQGWRFMLQR